MRTSLIEYIKSDLARLAKPNFKNFIKFYFFPKGCMFRYNVWYRTMQCVKRNRLSKILIGCFVYLIFRHYEFKYGIHINTNIPVGRGLKIVHGDGVYLNCKSIGDNFTCFQNVTLGANKGSEDIPIVKNNVTVCVGSIIVGNITLHDGCTVGANSFVNKDINPGDVVCGNPVKVLVNKEIN